MCQYMCGQPRGHDEGDMFFCSCTPVFVQVQLPWRQMYVGVCEGGGVRTSYDTVHLCQTPPPCAHLAGLLDIFKSKIVSCSG